MKPDLANWVAERNQRIAGWWDALKPDNRLSLLNWVARERGETQYGWNDEEIAQPWRYHADNDYATDDIDLAYQLAVEPDEDAR